MEPPANPGRFTISPGSSPGTLTITGDASLGAGSTIDIELAGTTPGTTYDVIAITGTVSLGGILEVSFLDGFDSQVVGSDVFTVIDAAEGLSGTFANVASGARLMTKDAFGSFLVSYGAGSSFDPTDVVLSAFQPVPEPGTAVLLALGLAGLGRSRRRARARQ